ncbi:MAG: HEAT repeat domain-containing protein [Planctomycetota bacterium]|nr:HEAT repeat domain-containing protein [Planctomycetota bacterium]
MIHTSPSKAFLRRASASRFLALALAPTLLPLVGCNSDKAVKKMMEPFFPPKPGEVARDAFNVYDADTRRNALAMLSSAKFGGEAPYVRVYRLLVDDPDATVRAAAIKALGEHGGVEDTKAILPRLKDEAAFVRWESAKALQKIHSPDAVGPLIDVMKDEDPDVRMAAAYALGQYPEPRVVNVLISTLDDQEFGVVEAGRQSLHTLTGQDFPTDGPAWLKWTEANRTDLFKDQQKYVWQPYVQPKSFVQKMQFWRKTAPVLPREPAGADAQAATSQPAAGS